MGRYAIKQVSVNTEFIDDNVNLCIVIGARVSEHESLPCAYVVDEASGERREISASRLVMAISHLAEGDMTSALRAIAAQLDQDED